MLRVRPAKCVCDFLKGLPEKIFYQIWRKILTLAENPCQQDLKKIGIYQDKDVFRVDTGEYRIIYQYDLQDLWLLLIGKRNDSEVYKEYKRKY